MASEKSTYATAYDAGQTSRVGGPNNADRDKPVRYIKDTITITEAANADGDYYDLGPAMFEGEVIPNQSFVRYGTGSTGTISSVVTLHKVTGSTATAVSGPATLNGLVADYFTDFAAATDLPTITKSDRLRLTITTANTATAGRTLEVWVAIQTKHGQ